MGKMAENPRYNVVSARLSDEERGELEAVRKVPLSIFVRQAVIEKTVRDRAERDAACCHTVPVICAWCRTQYGTKDGFLTNAPTHGVCPSCFDKFLENEIRRGRMNCPECNGELRILDDHLAECQKCKATFSLAGLAAKAERKCQ